MAIIYTPRKEQSARNTTNNKCFFKIRFKDKNNEAFSKEMQRNERKIKNEFFPAVFFSHIAMQYP